MKSTIALDAVVLSVVLVMPGAAKCMQANQAGEIAEGRLSIGSFEDAAGRPETAFTLTLPVPTCLAGPEDMDEDIDHVPRAKTIHLFSSEDAIAASIERLVGQDVHVRGTAFGTHTAHHHAPIVMDVSEIDAI